MERGEGKECGREGGVERGGRDASVEVEVQSPVCSVKDGGL